MRPYRLAINYIKACPERGEVESQSSGAWHRLAKVGAATGQL